MYGVYEFSFTCSFSFLQDMHQSLLSVDSGNNTDAAEYAERTSRTSYKQKCLPQYNPEFGHPSKCWRC